LQLICRKNSPNAKDGGDVAHQLPSVLPGLWAPLRRSSMAEPDVTAFVRHAAALDAGSFQLAAPAT